MSLTLRTIARVRSVAMVGVIAVAGSLIVASPASAATLRELPDADLGPVVAGASESDTGALRDPKSSKTKVVPSTDLPQPGTFDVVVPDGDASREVITEGVDDGGARVETPWVAVDETGISIAGAVPVDELKGDDSNEAIDSVSVTVVDKTTAARLGYEGLVVKIKRTDGVDAESPIALQVPDSLLNGVFGADYASRVRWVEVEDGTDASRVASASDPKSKSTIVTPEVGASSVMVAALAGPVSSSGTGDFTATSLAPSTLLDVSAQTGALSWTYPMRVPPAAAGPSPALSLNYDSQSVDGKTGSTNNQTSPVGEGWTLSGGGFVERSFVSCSRDNGASGPVTTSGDLCWKTNNATISFAGRSGELVKVADRITASNTPERWRLKNDDGSKIEHLVGTADGCKANGTYNTDCWRVTTTDGTQYYFGLNRPAGWASGTNATTTKETSSTWTVPVYGNDAGEPCNQSTFSASSCVQAWRWNLDYVVDVHNMAQVLYYNAETNKYAKNGSTTAATTYTRGGQLREIHYGMVGGLTYATRAASDKVIFTYDAKGRCSNATASNCTTQSPTGSATAPANASYYPDVPFDQLCTGSTCTGKVSPTFWTTARLSSIATQALIGTTYTTVDTWTLSHSYPDPGDTTSAALWLTQILHTGGTGTTALSEPPTKFTGVQMHNRVWAVDGLAPLAKYRIASIETSEGALISVNYSAEDCTPGQSATIKANLESNQRLCFPQWWSPDVTPPQAPQKDLFHKYLVTSVVSDPRTGGARSLPTETHYEYTGNAAWRYDNSALIPANKRTWSVWAGFDKVEVRVGPANEPAEQQTTEYTFYQGLDNDRASDSGGEKNVQVIGSSTLPDSLWFAGRVRTSTSFAGSGTGREQLSRTVTTPWGSAGLPATAGLDEEKRSHFVAEQSVVTTEPTSTGSDRSTTATNTYDGSTGLPLTVSNETSDDSVDTCTTTSYLPTSDSGVVGKVSQILTVAVRCADAASAEFPDDVINHTRFSYDQLAWNVKPTKGDQSKVEVATSYSGATSSTASWLTASTVTFDPMGRKLSVSDASDTTITNTYTPATAIAGAGALASQAVKNELNWTSTTNFDKSWGAVTSVVDPNTKTTSATYDALGRRTAVWYADRPKAANPTSPSVGYAYSLSATAASYVATTTLLSTGATNVSYELYDGLGRLVQTQSRPEASGTLITDLEYNRSGLTSAKNDTYRTTSVTPSGTLFVPFSLSQIPSRSEVSFDGVGRTIETSLISLGTERFHSTVGYSGADRSDVTPPSGGTPTSTYTNTLGQKTKLVQYLADTPTGTDTETTTYAYDSRGNLSAMTDPAGNTWEWFYNLLGQQVSAVDPDTGTTTVTYNNASNPVTTTDERDESVTYSYDSLNRPTALYEGSSVSGGKKIASWIYDTVAKGQLTSSSSYTGSEVGLDGAAYTTSVGVYDDAYRPKETTVSIPTAAPAFGGTSYTTKMTYFQDGNLATVALPAVGGIPAETLKYTYTHTGRLNTLVGLKAYVSTIYTGIGQVAQYARTGATSLYSYFGYDQATGDLSQIQQYTETGATLSQASNREYVYDDSGNVTSISEGAAAAGTETQCFEHDYLQNLTQAWTPSDGNCEEPATTSGLGGVSPYWNEYEVSTETGNRLSATRHAATAGGDTLTETYSYPASGTAKPHALQAVEKTVGVASVVEEYEYDPAGNSETRPGQSLTYDVLGRLDTIVAGSEAQSNIYNASGALLLRIDTSAGATLFLGDTELHAATGSSTASATRTYSLNGAPIAERTTTPGVSGSALNWLGVDGQGTALMQVNEASGSLLQRRQDPFGVSRGTSVSWSSDHSYLNAPASELSALVHLGAREYDPALGRFLSVDAVLDPNGPKQNNGYSYAHNNPVTLSDPSGLEPRAADDWKNGKGGTSNNIRAAYAPKHAKANPAGNAAAAVATAATTITWGVPSFYGGASATGATTATASGTAAAGSSVAATFFGLFASLLLVLSLSGDSSNAREASEGQGDAGEAATQASEATSPQTPDGCETIVLLCDQTKSGPAQINEANAEHTFRNQPGHVADTPANREIIRGAVKPENLFKITNNKDGTVVYRYKVMLEDGRQAWAEVVNGLINNGGINLIPK